MKPEFMAIDVECWRHTGKMGISIPAICLFHAEVDQGRVILQALDELHADSSHCKLTFKPTLQKRGITTLRLQLVPERAELRVLSIRYSPGAATIEMTSIGLPVIRDGVQAWCNGGEDFGVSADNARLKEREF